MKDLGIWGSRMEEMRDGRMDGSMAGRPCGIRRCGWTLQPGSLRGINEGGTRERSGTALGRFRAALGRCWDWFGRFEEVSEESGRVGKGRGAPVRRSKSLVSAFCGGKASHLEGPRL